MLFLPAGISQLLYLHCVIGTTQKEGTMITDQSLPDNKQCQGGSQRLTCHTCLIVSLEVISFSFIFGTQGLTKKGEVSLFRGRQY